jgi:hypothetical protein
MLVSTVQNSVVQATWRLVIVHPVYMYKQSVPNREHIIRSKDQPFDVVQADVPIYCGNSA